MNCWVVVGEQMLEEAGQGSLARAGEGLSLEEARCGIAVIDRDQSVAGEAGDHRRDVSLRDVTEVAPRSTRST